MKWNGIVNLKCVTVKRKLSTLWFQFIYITFSANNVQIMRKVNVCAHETERVRFLCTDSSSVSTHNTQCRSVCSQTMQQQTSEWKHKHRSVGCWYIHSSANCLANTSQHWSAALIDGTRASHAYKHVFIHLCNIDKRSWCRSMLVPELASFELTDSLIESEHACTHMAHIFFFAIFYAISFECIHSWKLPTVEPTQTPFFDKCFLKLIVLIIFHKIAFKQM